MKPASTDHPAYYSNYIRLVQQDNVVDALLAARKEMLAALKNIPAGLEEHAYAEGKWTVKQVFLHCVDTERVFAYRAMSFARGEAQKLPSFDENVYADNSNAHLRSLADIAEEYDAVSQANIIMFRAFPASVLGAAGEMALGRATVNAIGFTMAGHVLHHLTVLRERYLK